MLYKYLFSCVVVLWCVACKSPYSATQTPDDVYFSPNHFGMVQAKETVVTTTTTPDEGYLRMKCRNYSRWSLLDDFSYWQHSQYAYLFRPAYGYTNSCACGWSNSAYYQPSFWGWNSYFKPTTTAYVPKKYSGTTQASNMAAYNNKVYDNSNNAPAAPKWVKAKYNNTNATSNSADTKSTTTNSSRTYNNTSGSSDAGGRSGGFNSTGSSSSKPRNPK